MGQKCLQVDTKLINKEVAEENSVDDEAKVEKIPLKSRILLELCQKNTMSRIFTELIIIVLNV